MDGVPPKRRRTSIALQFVGQRGDLLDRSDEVQWVTGADAAPRLDAAGFAVRVGGLGEREGMAELDRQFPELRTMAPAERPDSTVDARARRG